MRPQRSLKARALQYLAQREHSRVELRRKLLPHAQAEVGEGDAGAAPAQVDALLDWLESHRYLSPERFVESRVHARAPRFGNMRIRHELQQHALTLPPEVAQQLKESELDRARQVCARRFSGSLGPAERAKQTRFLVSRGFSAETIRLVLRGQERLDDADFE